VDRELSAGVTWLVRDVHSGDALLLKKCAGTAESLRKRWREIARRGHGYLVIERDLLIREDGVVAVRPYVEGQPLRQLVDIPFERAASLLLAVAHDLEGLHRRRIVHGNLHANNVIVDRSGRPRLVDCLESHASNGSAIVAAPEQLRGHGPTARSDIHALGVVAFELLVKRAPFSAPRQLEAIQSALYDEVALSPEEERALPRGVPQLLHTAMAKHESERFSSAELFAVALRKLAPGASSELPPHPRRGPQAIVTAAWRRSIPWAQRLVSLAHRLWLLPRRIRTGFATFASVAVVGIWIAVNLTHTRSLERRVEALLVAGDPWHARRVVAADERHGHLAVHDKLLGDVSCAQGDLGECIRRYDRALRQSSRYATNDRLRRNALALLPREDHGGAIPALLAKVGGIEGTLVEAARSEPYWKRWNAVRALERRGDQDEIDYVQVYTQDLLHSGSCATRRAALSRLLQRGDRASLRALELARAQSEASWCLGGDLPRAIGVLASSR
jgi:hypothetical protein